MNETRREKTIGIISEMAGALYRSREMLCSEAIFFSFNQVLKGGLTKETCVGLAAAFPIGLGDAGCLCGAVSGGAMSIGYFLSRAASRIEIRAASKELHDAFKEKYGSTCCRVLSGKVKDDPQKHFQQCLEITLFSAGKTGEIILEKLPQLADTNDFTALKIRTNPLSSLLLRLGDAIR